MGGDREQGLFGGQGPLGRSAHSRIGSRLSVPRASALSATSALPVTMLCDERSAASSVGDVLAGCRVEGQRGWGHGGPRTVAPWPRLMAGVGDRVAWGYVSKGGPELCVLFPVGRGRPWWNKARTGGLPGADAGHPAAPGDWGSAGSRALPPQPLRHHKRCRGFGELRSRRGWRRPRVSLLPP